MVTVVPARTAYVLAVPRPGAVDASAAIQFDPTIRPTTVMARTYLGVFFTAAS